MKLLYRDGDALAYVAQFWDGPLSSDSKGRYVERKIEDRIIPRLRTEFVDGERRTRLIGHRLANTARSVSYYPALEKALKIKWGEC